MTKAQIERFLEEILLEHEQSLDSEKDEAITIIAMKRMWNLALDQVLINNPVKEYSRISSVGKKYDVRYLIDEDAINKMKIK